MRVRRGGARESAGAPRRGIVGGARADDRGGSRAGSRTRCAPAAVRVRGRLQGLFSRRAAGSPARRATANRRRALRRRAGGRGRAVRGRGRDRSTRTRSPTRRRCSPATACSWHARSSIVSERYFTRARIIGALEALGDELTRTGVRGQIFIVGGAAMALAYSTRRVTKDIDAVFEPKSAIYTAAAKVAEDLVPRRSALRRDQRACLRVGAARRRDRRCRVTTRRALPTGPVLAGWRPAILASG